MWWSKKQEKKLITGCLSTALIAGRLCFVRARSATFRLFYYFWTRRNIVVLWSFYTRIFFRQKWNFIRAPTWFKRFPFQLLAHFWITIELLNSHVTMTESTNAARKLLNFGLVGLFVAFFVGTGQWLRVTIIFLFFQAFTSDVGIRCIKCLPRDIRYLIKT